MSRDGHLSVSWSALRRWEECRQKHLRTMQGKSGIRDGRVFLPGTVADRIMRAWLSQEDPQPGWMADNADEWVRRFVEPRTEEERVDPDRDTLIRWRGNANADRQLVTNFVRLVVTELEPILLKLVIPHEYHPELLFRTTIGIPYLDGRLTPVDLIGGIDIVTRLLEPAFGLEKGDYVFYDLKATSDPDYVRKVLGQSIFYDIAGGHYFGDTAQPRKFGYIVPATREKVLWANITENDRRAMMSRIVAFAHGNWRRDWAPKESEQGCAYCEVRHACIRYEVVPTKNEQGRNVASIPRHASRRPRRPGSRTKVS